jgi:Tfp pilus assembly protein PilW
MHKNLKAITLMELLIAVILMTIVVLGLTNIDFFSRFHLISADRRANLQNEVSYILEHMVRQISQAIGNEAINGPDSVISTDDNASRTLMRIYIDASGNGQREVPQNNPNPTDDHWISYRYQKQGNNRYTMEYCSRCRQDNCNNCMDSEEVLSSENIANFDPGKPSGSTLINNSITVQVTGCWDPAIDLTANPNGTTDNPCIAMNGRIEMSSVSTN